MRSMIRVALAAGLLGSSGGAWAQTIDPNAQIPIGPPTAFAASPDGARYYPGIGFRYVLPPSERVYGYYAGPRVYGYQARQYRRACDSNNFWFWDRRCGYGRGRW